MEKISQGLEILLDAFGSKIFWNVVKNP